ncbi:MAG: hypothetical protein KGQ38_04065 [Actinomycetales bacterium]|nr:hypothetical protein [Actinomycetales bacterium]
MIELLVSRVVFQNFVLVLTSATPAPSATNFDDSRVQPGAWYGFILTFLIIGLVILLFSLNRHLKRINFEESKEDSSE